MKISKNGFNYFRGEREMASDEHKDLAGFIKNVHKELREEVQRSGDSPHSVWEKHLLRREKLQKYAAAMRTLATNHWTDQNNSRIFWLFKHIHHYYFTSGIQAEHGRDSKFARRQGKILPQVNLPNIDRARVLDVGSCYNPFSVYEELGLLSIFR